MEGRALLYLIWLIAVRVFMVGIVLAIIFNPWFSFYHIVRMAIEGDTWRDTWLYQLIGALILAAAVILFVRTTKQAMGKWGLGIAALILVLIAYIPFFAGFLEPDPVNVGYMAYFFILPVLLGIGVSTGYFNRYLTGTLIVKPAEGEGNIHGDHPTSAVPETHVHAPVAEERA